MTQPTNLFSNIKLAPGIKLTTFSGTSMATPQTRGVAERLIRGEKPKEQRDLETARTILDMGQKLEISREEALDRYYAPSLSPNFQLGMSESDKEEQRVEIEAKKASIAAIMDKGVPSHDELRAMESKRLTSHTKDLFSSFKDNASDRKHSSQQDGLKALRTALLSK